MKKEEIFMEVKLPLSGTAEVIEAKGMHYFTAMSKAKGDSGLLIKHLIIELVRIDKKKMTEKIVDDMHLRDINYLSSVINTMMSDDFSNGI